jgi:hypothetical protein
MGSLALVATPSRPFINRNVENPSFLSPKDDWTVAFGPGSVTRGTENAFQDQQTP